MDSKLVLEHEQRRLEALMSKDFAALDALHADGLTYIHSNGKVDGKADVIAKMRTAFRYHSMTRGELNVRTFGDTAVVTGPMDVQFIAANDDSVQSMAVMLTQVWVLRDDRLQMVAYQVGKRDWQ